MKIVKAIFEGVNFIPPKNEPYKTERLVIFKIEHVYEDNSFDVYLNSIFGSTIEPEFYTILTQSCKVELKITTKIYRDDYYQKDEFKRACFNKTQNNPYQFPVWTTLK